MHSLPQTAPKTQALALATTQADAVGTGQNYLTKPSIFARAKVAHTLRRDGYLVQLGTIGDHACPLTIRRAGQG